MHAHIGPSSPAGHTAHVNRIHVSMTPATWTTTPDMVARARAFITQKPTGPIPHVMNFYPLSTQESRALLSPSSTALQVNKPPLYTAPDDVIPLYSLITANRHPALALLQQNTARTLTLQSLKANELAAPR
eukprot:3120574-Rhodomonas_salina.1